MAGCDKDRVRDAGRGQGQCDLQAQGRLEGTFSSPPLGSRCHLSILVLWVLGQGRLQLGSPVALPHPGTPCGCMTFLPAALSLDLEGVGD